MADDILTFLSVCREGSFLAAGHALGLATSTVSRRIDQLEARLGVRLLERSTRGLTLTAAGALLRDRATPAALSIQEAEDAVRALMRRPAGRLCVVAPSAMLRAPIGAVALDYLRELPDVSLELVGADEDVVPDGVRVHLVIRVSRKLPPASLTQRVLGRVPMVICASPAWIAARPPLVEPADLAEHGCVVLGSEPGAARIWMRRGGESRCLTVPIALFTTSIPLARRAGVAGVGPVGLPTESCVDLLRDGRLVEILAGWRLDPVPVVALYPGQLPLRARAFLDRLIVAFA